MKIKKNHAVIPIGRTATMAFEIDEIRAGCSSAAGILCRRKNIDEAELDECARLDDALAEAQRLLKAAVRNIMLSRIARRSSRARSR